MEDGRGIGRDTPAPAVREHCPPESVVVKLEDSDTQLICILVGKLNLDLAYGESQRGESREASHKSVAKVASRDGNEWFEFRTAFQAGRWVRIGIVIVPILTC